MATHAHSTRTSLLPQSGNLRPLLGQGLGRQLGPVSRAIRACREIDPVDQAIADIQIGLASFFADADRQRVRELRRRIADRIEADLALLDALDGDPDTEPSLGAPEPVITGGIGYGVRCRHSDQAHWAGGNSDDQEYDVGSDREEENEHGGDIQDEPHDPQPDDVLPRMHRWDPQVADGARKARRQVEAMRARKDREARA